MKSVMLWPVVGLFLASAAPPAPFAGVQDYRLPGGYPPCSRTVTDRCIQLYERRVNTSVNLALNRRLGPPQWVLAMAEPFEAILSPPPASAKGQGSSREYPPCSAEITDRCMQVSRSDKRSTRTATAKPVKRAPRRIEETCPA